VQPFTLNISETFHVAANPIAANLLGAISFGGSSTVQIDAGATLQSSATLHAITGVDVTNNGTLVANVQMDAGSTLSGSGAVVGAVTSAGTVSPSNSGATSPAELQIQGGFGSTGKLYMVIAGPLSGQYDSIGVNGNATVSGKIAVALGGGYVPAGCVTLPAGKS
jgi:hypothetical protein